MDTFFEQIIKIKLSGKVRAIIFGILFVDALIIAGVLLFTLAYSLPLSVLVVGVVIWGSYKLLGMTSIEYEYIFTNGDLDFDKIISKSSRKRVVSVKCAKVQKYGDYIDGMAAPGSVKNTYHFCNPDDKAKYMIVPHKNEGNIMIVFAPDERMADAIEKILPRIAK